MTTLTKLAVQLPPQTIKVATDAALVKYASCPQEWPACFTGQSR